MLTHSKGQPELRRYAEAPEMSNVWLENATIDLGTVKATEEGLRHKGKRTPVVKVAFTTEYRCVEVWLHPRTQRVLGVVFP